MNHPLTTGQLLKRAAEARPEFTKPIHLADYKLPKPHVRVWTYSLIHLQAIHTVAPIERAHDGKEWVPSSSSGVFAWRYKNK